MGFYFIVLIVLIGTVGVLLSKSPSNQPIYSDIVRLFEEEKVKKFVIDDSVLTATLYDGSTVVYSIPYLDLFFDELGDLISAQGYEFRQVEGAPCHRRREKGLL